MENNSFSDQTARNNRGPSGRKPPSVWDILRKIVTLRTRTKLLGIFSLMFFGLFYANAVIIQQTKVSNDSIESQSKVMTNQAVLSDTISCFGAIKYWFAILDNGLKKSPVQLPDESA